MLQDMRVGEVQIFCYKSCKNRIRITPHTRTRKISKNHEFLSFFKKTVLALVFLSLPFQFLSKASANLLVFVARKDVSQGRIDQGKHWIN